MCIAFINCYSSTNTLDFLNEYQITEIYQTGKNMRLLLKMFSPKIKTKINKLRENIKILASSEGNLRFDVNN